MLIVSIFLLSRLSDRLFSGALTDAPYGVLLICDKSVDESLTFFLANFIKLKFSRNLNSFQLKLFILDRIQICNFPSLMAKAKEKLFSFHNSPSTSPLLRAPHPMRSSAHIWLQSTDIKIWRKLNKALCKGGSFGWRWKMKPEQFRSTESRRGEAF